MKTFTIALVALFASVAMAAPTELDARQSSVCPAGLFGNPQCCSTFVLGAVGLDCSVPNSTPQSVENFRTICSSQGKAAGCCVLPVAGQGVLCQAL